MLAEEICSYVARSTLRNATTVYAHVVKVGNEYFEIRTPATAQYNEMEPGSVQKIKVHQVALCSAIALAVEQARSAKSESD